MNTHCFEVLRKNSEPHLLESKGNAGEQKAEEKKFEINFFCVAMVDSESSSEWIHVFVPFVSCILSIINAFGISRALLISIVEIVFTF